MEHSIEEIRNEEVTEDISIKIVIVGDSGVGKSNILTRYARDLFNPESKITVGVELFSKTFRINSNVVKIHLWDTAGQERFKSITAAYYKGCKGAVIVYDITKQQSFENVDKWFNELREYAEKNVQIIMIGNKSDLSELRAVDIQKAKDKADTLGIGFMETSALSASNINEAFKKLINEIYLNFLKASVSAGKQEDQNENYDSKNFVRIDGNKTEKEKKKNCC